MKKTSKISVKNIITITDKAQKIGLISKKDIEAILLIKFLLKEQGLTIAGAKKAIGSKLNKLDDNTLSSVKASYIKANIKNKSKLLLKKIKKIKYNGKKDTY